VRRSIDVARMLPVPGSRAIIAVTPIAGTPERDIRSLQPEAQSPMLRTCSRLFAEQTDWAALSGGRGSSFRPAARDRSLRLSRPQAWDWSANGVESVTGSRQD
jgi:hypothetical protein